MGFAGGVLLRDNRLTAQVRQREREILVEFPTIAELLARAAAAQVLADQGSPGQVGRVRVTCTTPAQGSCHVGTAVITVEVGSAVELPLAPRILGHQAAGFAVGATHTVPIGQYVESAP